MPRILFVCTANICRSPVAEGLLRDRIRRQGESGWEVESAGTWARIRRGAARDSIDILARQGIDIKEHRSQEVNAALLERADLILCMENGHAEALRAEFPAVSDRVYLLSEMVGSEYGISDPFGKSREDYETMVASISELIDEGLPRIMGLARAFALSRAG